MSGTAPGPEFPPPGEPNPQAPPAYAYPPPVPPAPRREPRDTTVRNLLVVLLVAIFTIVPATGMWVVASLKDKTSDDAASAGTTGKAAAQNPQADPSQPAVVAPPSVEPVDPNPPAQAQPQPGGGGAICCCDGAASKCTSPKKGCCKRHGGICPCQGGR
jgi:hypothetical protein